jgi:hypothetical protein
VTELSLADQKAGGSWITRHSSIAVRGPSAWPLSKSRRRSAEYDWKAAVAGVIACSVIWEGRRAAEYGFSFKRGSVASMALLAVHVSLVISGRFLLSSKTEAGSVPKPRARIRVSRRLRKGPTQSFTPRLCELSGQAGVLGDSVERVKSARHNVQLDGNSGRQQPLRVLYIFGRKQVD